MPPRADQVRNLARRRLEPSLRQSIEQANQLAPRAAELRVGAAALRCARRRRDVRAHRARGSARTVALLLLLLLLKLRGILSGRIFLLFLSLVVVAVVVVVVVVVGGGGGGGGADAESSSSLSVTLSGAQCSTKKPYSA